MTSHKDDGAPLLSDITEAFRAGHLSFREAVRLLLPGGFKWLDHRRVPFVDVSGRRNGMPLTDAQVARLLTPAQAGSTAPLSKADVEDAVASTMIAVLGQMRKSGGGKR